MRQHYIKILATCYQWVCILVMTLLTKNASGSPNLAGPGLPGLDGLGSVLGAWFTLVVGWFCFVNVMRIHQGKEQHKPKHVSIVLFLMCSTPWVIKPELSVLTLIFNLLFIYTVWTLATAYIKKVEYQYFAKGVMTTIWVILAANLLYPYIYNWSL